MKLEIRLNDDQRAALIQAAEAAHLSIDEFALLAFRVLATRYGVDIPASVIRPYNPNKQRTGRPPKAPGAMTRHVPAGNWSRVCPVCQREFRVDDTVIVYCSDECETRAQNRRSYQRRKLRTKNEW